VTTWQEQAKAAAKSLIVAAGMASSVASADIGSAAKQISVGKNYPNVTTRQIEEEIKKHIRK
jgi:hypothetical protein